MPAPETRLCESVEATLRLGEELGRRLPGGSVVLLEGELGAGKTHFAKGLAVGLGLSPDDVVSPSFTIVQVHENPRGRGLGLVHVDLYRLEDEAELDELGLDELPGDSKVAAVEWPDRLGGREPEGCWRVALEEAGEGERLVTLAPPPAGAPPPGRVL